MKYTFVNVLVKLIYIIIMVTTAKEPESVSIILFLMHVCIIR